MKQLTQEDVRAKIVRLPGRPPAMIDRYLAMLYGTQTARLNESVKNNSDWFEDGYRFQLNESEINIVKNDINYRRGRYPFAYTHEGCNAAAFILNSKAAKEHRKVIIKVFTEIEKVQSEHQLSALDLQQLTAIHQDAARWRMEQLATNTLLSIKDIENWLKYRRMSLKKWEIARLLNISETSVRRYDKMLEHALAPVKDPQFQIPEPRLITGRNRHE